MAKDPKYADVLLEWSVSHPVYSYFTVTITISHNKKAQCSGQTVQPSLLCLVYLR